jgi:hypothetical protein
MSRSTYVDGESTSWVQAGDGQISKWEVLDTLTAIFQIILDMHTQVLTAMNWKKFV